MYVCTVCSSDRLQPFQGLHRVGVRSIWRGQGVAADEGADGLKQKLHVFERVVSLHLLVQVAVEGHALHVVALAELNEGFSGSVGGVEHLILSLK